MLLPLGRSKLPLEAPMEPLLFVTPVTNIIHSHLYTWFSKRKTACLNSEFSVSCAGRDLLLEELSSRNVEGQRAMQMHAEGFHHRFRCLPSLCSGWLGHPHRSRLFNILREHVAFRGTCLGYEVLLNSPFPPYCFVHFSLLLFQQLAGSVGLHGQFSTCQHFENIHKSLNPCIGSFVLMQSQMTS